MLSNVVYFSFFFFRWVNILKRNTRRAISQFTCFRENEKSDDASWFCFLVEASSRNPNEWCLVIPISSLIHPAAIVISSEIIQCSGFLSTFRVLFHRLSFFPRTKGFFIGPFYFINFSTSTRDLFTALRVIRAHWRLNYAFCVLSRITLIFLSYLKWIFELAKLQILYIYEAPNSLLELLQQLGRSSKCRRRVEA